MKQKRWIWPIVAGFAVMYLTMMFLATYMTKWKFADEYLENMMDALSNIQGQAIRQEQTEFENEAYTDEQRKSYYEYLFSVTLSSGNLRGYQLLSGAVYDVDGQLIAATDNIIGNTRTTTIDSDMTTQYRYFSLDMLTSEEQEELAHYVYAHLEKYILGKAEFTPNEYRVSVKLSKDGNVLYGIIVQKITWEESEHADGYCTDPLTGSKYSWDTGKGEYVQTGSEIVWEWNVPGAEMLSQDEYEIQKANVEFPYLWTGKEYWRKWNQSEYLNDFEEQITAADYHEVIDILSEKIMEMEADTYQFPGQEMVRVLIQPYGSDENYYYLELRSECHPWLAAMDYLKYVYLVGFALMLVCMVKIIYVTNKTYEQRAALEETRRDFTNAMAHELKTPLGIIRGFAENLKEHTTEEKRDYYLEQIIGQTEEMDHLVADMIEVSRLDSEKLVLQQENVSLTELCREQLKRLEPVVQEKNLRIQYLGDEDCQVIGDRNYLARALWNLLSNAAAYNVQDGTIRVISKRDELWIENTGFPLEEELLVHAFEMFYSGDKSRNSREKHMGLGLFLTKKILDRHRMKITIENMADGVRVTVKNGKNMDL